MSPTNRKKASRVLRLLARVGGTTISVFFAAMLVGDAAISIQQEGFQGLTTESFFVLVPVVFALTAFMISWWRERLGSVLLILAYPVLSSAPTIHSLYYGRGFHLYFAMWLVALPFLAAGILFLIASRLSRAEKPAEDKTL